MPPRKNHAAKPAPRGTKAPFARKRSRLVKRMARGALFAVGFTALQYFGEDLADQTRLFDHRVVDNLQAPLTHYHE